MSFAWYLEDGGHLGDEHEELWGAIEAYVGGSAASAAYWLASPPPFKRIAGTS